MAKAPADETSAQQDKAPVRNTKGRNLVVLCDGTDNELGGALSDEISDIRISNVPELRLRSVQMRGSSAFANGRFQTGLCGWLPRCKCKVMIWPLVGCSRLSGLLMQSV